MTKPRKVKMRRGCPPGRGTRVGTVRPTGEPGGRIGMPPFIPTDEQRAEVRRLAEVINQEAIAILIGVSPDTIRRHFKKEFEEGRTAAIAELGANVLASARSGDKRSRNFYLRTYGGRYGWSPKMELTGKDGGPIEHIDVDLSRLTDEQLEEYGRLAAIAGGYDPDAITIVDGVVSPGEGEA